MKTAKYITIVLTGLFIFIVVLGGIPGVCVNTDVPLEKLMFGLFRISLLDDVTHGFSGLLGILALTMGSRWIVKYLMLIGGYYALDAFFFFTYGLMTGQSLISNLMLNGPHILISILIAIALKKSVKHIELAE